MRITFIGHASILVETGGIRILSDPWWRGPCFGAQWWPYPSPCPALVDERLDYIYVSHGHHDHFHPGTLKTLPRSATGLVSVKTGLAASFRELGFPVVELDDAGSHELAPGVSCMIEETDGGDTLCAIDDGASVCVNLNDALHAAPAEVQDRFVAKLRERYPRIDYLFCGYGVASHFPNCYDIPGKDREATAARRQMHFSRQWARIVAALEPRFAFPFAADVALLENDLIWANAATHNSARPVDVLRAEHPGLRTKALDIAPGFVIDDGVVVANPPRAPTTIERLRSECAEGILRANTYGSVTNDVFEEVLELFRNNVALCGAYLADYDGDYRFLVRFRNFARAIEMVKRGRDVGVRAAEDADERLFDLVFVTRLHYLRASLATAYGHEILFVGSGGVFRYARAGDVKKRLHHELMTVLKRRDGPPAPRFGSRPPWLGRLKRSVKRGLGLSSQDLYDLDAWTVWSEPAERRRA